MNDPRDERLGARLAEQLRGLLADAVSDVEPSDSLDALHHRTKVTSMNSRRPWLFAVGGAVVATAAVITAIALVGGGLAGRDTAEPTPVPATQSNEPSPSEPSPTDEPTASTEPPAPAAVTVPAYFVGETPSGLRLYREFQEVVTDDAATKAVDLAVTGAALDPDYSSPWPDGTTVASATYDGDVITVNLEEADVGGPELGLHNRPAGMSEAEASMAVEQVIYTAQAGFQKGRPGVQFLINGERTDQVLGVPTSEPLANGPVLQTLALVSLTTPTEGQTVTGDTLEVSGVANSFEANVVVRLQRWEGTEIMFQEPITAEGWMGEKLFPFEGSFDISDVPPGDYLLMAMTDDPSGGAEGGGSHTDSKRITVK